MPPQNRHEVYPHLGNVAATSQEDCSCTLLAVEPSRHTVGTSLDSAGVTVAVFARGMFLDFSRDTTQFCKGLNTIHAAHRLSNISGGLVDRNVVDWEVHSFCFLNQTGRQNVTIKLRLLLLRLQVSLQLCARGPSFPGAAAAATSAVSTLAAPTAVATSAFPGAATAAATAVQEQSDPGIRIGCRHGIRGGDNHKQGSLKSIGLKKKGVLGQQIYYGK